MNARVRLALLLVVLMSLAGCTFFGGEEATPTPFRLRPTPTSVPTPTPLPPTPTVTLPTPTPTPITSRRDVEGQAWDQVSRCVEQVSKATAGKEVRVALASRYDPATGTWTVEASSQDPLLTYGLWRVEDRTGQIAPLDGVAKSIAAAGNGCTLPTAFLAAGLTPPQFTAVPSPTPTPTPIPTPVKPAVASGEEAALRVWVQVYSCYNHFPLASSFTAVTERPGRYIVEGRSATAQYGLWMVEAATGDVTPLDQLAKNAAQACGKPIPSAVSGEQATLRVWIAVYNCIAPPPALSVFTANPNGPQQWVVEGRKETIAGRKVERKVGEVTETYEETENKTISYGIWLVKTDTGTIQPWDATAKTIARDTCYQPP